MVQFILALLMLFMGLFSMAPPATFDAFPVAQVIEPDITYPPDLDTNTERLEAVIAILELMRLEHNIVGAGAIANWKRDEGRWQTYTELFDTKQSPLLGEYRRLKDRVRKESFSDLVWSGKTGDERDALYESLYGDKATLRTKPTLATSRLLDELKAVDFATLTGEYVDPIQDFAADYTEVDTNPGGILAVTTITPGLDSTIVITNLTRTSETWVYKDFGASFFGTTGIDHDISSRAEDFDGANPEIFIWALANQNNPVHSTDPIISLAMRDRSGTDMRYNLDLDEGATTDSDLSIDHDLATQYYLTITRESDGTIVDSFNNAARSDLRDTMTVVQGSTEYQFMVLAFSRAGSGTQVSNGSIFDLDLNLAVADRRRAIIISQRR